MDDTARTAIEYDDWVDDPGNLASHVGGILALMSGLSAQEARQASERPRWPYLVNMATGLLEGLDLCWVCAAAIVHHGPSPACARVDGGAGWVAGRPLRLAGERCDAARQVARGLAPARGGLSRTVTGAIECPRHRPRHRTVTSVEQLEEPWHCDFAGRPSSGRFG